MSAILVVPFKMDDDFLPGPFPRDQDMRAITDRLGGFRQEGRAAFVAFLLLIGLLFVYSFSAIGTFNRHFSRPHIGQECVSL